jgi:carboxyl-terminal processing protease
MSVMLVVAMFVGMGLDRVLIETGIAATSLTRADEFETLEETYEAIRENYVLQDEISDEDLIYGASKGMVEALGDTGHSTFLDPQEAVEYQQSTEGELVGIGVRVDTSGELPVVIAPMQNSPAFEAGILPGDTIIAVDGQSLETMDTSDAVDLITGEEGTDVTLELRHANEDASYTVTITRARIEVDPVTWVMLPDGVMWLHLAEFSRGASDSLKAAIVEGQELGMTGLILDLRGNPGGLVVEAVGVASQFVPDGTPLFQREDAEEKVDVVETVGNRGVYLEGEMVVLIDNNSASSSEIVASALRDSGRAPLYGEQTFGVGTVLLPFQLSDGSLAVLGTELLLTGAGERLFMEGVAPTVEVPLGDDQTTGFILIEDSDQDNKLTEEELSTLEDDQLHAAYDAVLQPVE